MLADENPGVQTGTVSGVDGPGVGVGRMRELGGVFGRGARVEVGACGDQDGARGVDGRGDAIGLAWANSNVRAVSDPVGSGVRSSGRGSGVWMRVFRGFQGTGAGSVSEGVLGSRARSGVRTGVGFGMIGVRHESPCRSVPIGAESLPGALVTLCGQTGMERRRHGPIYIGPAAPCRVVNMRGRRVGMELFITSVDGC